MLFKFGEGGSLLKFCRGLWRSSAALLEGEKSWKWVVLLNKRKVFLHFSYFTLILLILTQTENIEPIKLLLTMSSCNVLEKANIFVLKKCFS